MISPGIVYAANGSVGSVVVTGNMTDTSTSGENRVLARRGIEKVVAASLSYSKTSNPDGGCRIIANRTPRVNNGGFELTDGKLGRLETTSGDCKALVQAFGLGSGSTDGIFIAGHLQGDLEKEIGFSSVPDGPASPPITKPIRIAGDLNAAITSDGALASTGSIIIGGSLNSIITIREGQPIAGQIIINANNNGGIWAASAAMSSVEHYPMTMYRST